MFSARCIFLIACLMIPAKASKPLLLTFERSLVKSFDSKYVSNVTTKVGRANRSAPYSWNLEFYIIKAWAGNVSIDLKTYEQRNNEYRESIIRAKIDVCVAIESDKWITPTIRKYSNVPTKCPFKVGFLTLKDVILPGDLLPAHFPLAKWRFDFFFYVPSTMKYILKIQLFFRVESSVPKKGKDKKPK